jgi:hypothetical protein
MATILTFRPTAPERDDSAARAKASAEVIVFPGVRYERWEEAGEAAPPQSSRTKSPDVRRDVLELVE